MPCDACDQRQRRSLSSSGRPKRCWTRQGATKAMGARRTSASVPSTAVARSASITPTPSNGITAQPAVVTGLEKLRRLAMTHYPYTTAIRLAKHVVTTSEWKARVAPACN